MFAGGGQPFTDSPELPRRVRSQITASCLWSGAAGLEVQMFFTPNLVVGLTIMAVGVVLLLDTLGIREVGSFMRYWPFLIVLFGASLVAQAFKPVDPAAPKRQQGGVPCFFLFLLGVAMFWTFGLPGGDRHAGVRQASDGHGNHGPGGDERSRRRPQRARGGGDGSIDARSASGQPCAGRSHDR